LEAIEERRFLLFHAAARRAEQLRAEAGVLMQAIAACGVRLGTVTSSAGLTPTAPASSVRIPRG
jgi:hypothetical protein